MAGSTDGPPPPGANESTKSQRKRNLAELDTMATESSSPAVNSNEIIDLTSADQHTPPRKQRRVGPSNSTIPRTLPMAPHEDVLAELKGKYVILTASIISSSNIHKKVDQVLDHLGFINMMDPDCLPGVMMVHARARDINKLVTVMEKCKHRLSERKERWFQYNRVYEVAEEQGGGKKKENIHNGDSDNGCSASGTGAAVDDTIMGAQEEQDQDGAFEPTRSLHDLTLRDRPTAELNKNAFISIFLARVPMPELRAKPSFTEQNNEVEISYKH